MSAVLNQRVQYLRRLAEESPRDKGLQMALGVMEGKVAMHNAPPPPKADPVPFEPEKKTAAKTTKKAAKKASRK